MLLCTDALNLNFLEEYSFWKEKETNRFAVDHFSQYLIENELVVNDTLIF